MVLTLPGFGLWAAAIRDFETPYGSAGIRQLEVLYMLRHELLPPTKPTATALAERFGIQRSVVTRILAKLESAGYIIREPDQRDGRAWQIIITENGRNLSDYVEREYFKEMEAALGDISVGDVACLERCLNILVDVAVNLGIREHKTRFANDWTKRSIGDESS
jgi:DNA-binding MarR family transcriptional regulator